MCPIPPFAFVVQQVSEFTINAVFSFWTFIRAQLVHHAHLRSSRQVEPYEFHRPVLRGEDGFRTGLFKSTEPLCDEFSCNLPNPGDLRLS